MGRIYYIFGKSASGKDTLYHLLMEDPSLSLKSIILYTTRPMREGEQDGDPYRFKTEEEFQALKRGGLVIEDRAYETIHGLWRYFMVKDEHLSIDRYDYLVTGGVLSSYLAVRDYFGKERVLPVYIELDDGLRLTRALAREMQPENRRFKEMCRRFLADDEDFSEEKLKEAGIERRFVNEDLNSCLSEIREYIRSTQK